MLQQNIQKSKIINAIATIVNEAKMFLQGNILTAYIIKVIRSNLLISFFVLVISLNLLYILIHPFISVATYCLVRL